MNIQAAKPKQLSASVTSQIVNPLIASTLDAFQMMADVKLTRGELSLLTGKTPFHPVNAVIQLSGHAKGSICVSLQRRTAFALVYRMVELQVSEVNNLVCDTVAEFANVIAGTAKDKLQDLNLELGLPNVVLGTDCQVHFPSVSTPMYVTFNSTIGPLMIAFGFCGNA